MIEYRVFPRVRLLTMINVASKISIIFLLLVSFAVANGQTINGDVPAKIDPTGKYVIYLHGGIVGAMGADNAVSEYYGRYEYRKILTALASNGFYVISEVRPKDTKEEEYALKVNKQIRKLTRAGVPQQSVIVLGASLGAYIAVESAFRLRKPKVKFVLLGLCSKYAVNYYQKYNKK